MDAGSRYESFYAGERIPTFTEFLELAALYRGQLYVELKAVDPMKVLAEVSRVDMLDRCFFWSYTMEHLRILRAASAEARLMVRRQDVPSLKAAQALSPEIIEFTLQDDLSEIAHCRGIGLRSMLAYMGGRDRDIFDKIVAARPPDIATCIFLSCSVTT